MLKPIRIDLLSHAHHLNQILTGYHLLSLAEGRKLIIEDHAQDKKYRLKKTALVVEIDGKKIVYDMADGYQSVETMKYLLSSSDFYFKRSYSKVDNDKFDLQGILPLGMNYDVTWLGNPLSCQRKYGRLRSVVEAFSGELITPDKVECIPQRKDTGHTIMFSARLWPRDNRLSEQENTERMEINQSRIEIMRKLRERYGSWFIGGLEKSELSMTLAPDLILDKRFTRRSKYLKTMRQADICIGTSGLHKSTGGKMGEYVAASRAIVCERIYYEVPGDFNSGKNYFEFETPDRCLDKVHELIKNPEKLYSVQCANRDYYEKYLEPEQLVRNSLNKVGVKI